MNEIIEKLKQVKRNLSEQKPGSVIFLGLFKRQDLDNKWDVVLSATWVSDKKEADFVFVITLLKKVFNDNLDFLAKIVLLKPEEHLVKEIAALKPGNYKDLQVADATFGELELIE